MLCFKELTFWQDLNIYKFYNKYIYIIKLNIDWIVVLIACWIKIMSSIGRNDIVFTEYFMSERVRYGLYYSNL